MTAQKCGWESKMKAQRRWEEITPRETPRIGAERARMGEDGYIPRDRHLPLPRVRTNVTSSPETSHLVESDQTKVPYRVTNRENQSPHQGW
jgi:hypothetical protein